MHTLFTLEDRYGLTVETGENGVSLRVDPRKGKDAAELSEMLTAWAQQAEKLHNGETNRETTTSGVIIIRSTMKLPVL